MAKLLHPTADRPIYVPEDQRGRPIDDRVAYRLRVPTVDDEARFARAVRALGGRYWSIYEMLALAAEAVVETAPEGAEREAMLAAVARHRLAIETAAQRSIDLRRAEGVPDEERAEANAAVGVALADPELARLMERLARDHDRLRAAEADNAVWPQIRGNVAARLFVVGWYGPPAARWGDPRRDAGGLDDASLRRIPAHHRRELAGFVDDLMAPDEAEAKNSASPSGGPNPATDSPAASSTTAATP